MRMLLGFCLMSFILFIRLLSVLFHVSLFHYCSLRVPTQLRIYKLICLRESMHLCHVEITQTLSPSIQSPSLHATRSLDLDHFTRDAPIDCGDNWRYGLTGSIQGWGMPRSAPTTCHAVRRDSWWSRCPPRLGGLDCE